MKLEHFVVPPGKKIKLKDFDPGATNMHTEKQDAQQKLEEDVVRPSDLQDVLYAQDIYALLVSFQGKENTGE